MRRCLGLHFLCVCVASWKMGNESYMPQTWSAFDGQMESICFLSTHTHTDIQTNMSLPQHPSVSTNRPREGKLDDFTLSLAW